MFDRLGVIGIIFFLLGLSPKEDVSLNEVVDEKPATIVSESSLKSQDTLSKDVVEKEYKDITVKVTYYTNIDDTLQGGQEDRKGVPLTAHNEPIVAMPSDIPYGSVLDINGIGKFKVVDTGGAITWIDENTCKVDVFIPNVSYDWILNNTENYTANARIYYNK